MTKGTTSQGARHGRTHILCRRCGRNSYHVQWERCAACAYPRASRRRYNWSVKAIKRRKTGTGRCRYLKVVNRRIANHFKTPQGLSKRGKTTTRATTKHIQSELHFRRDVGAAQVGGVCRKTCGWRCFLRVRYCSVPGASLTVQRKHGPIQGQLTLFSICRAAKRNENPTFYHFLPLSDRLASVTAYLFPLTILSRRLLVPQNKKGGINDAGVREGLRGKGPFITFFTHRCHTRIVRIGAPFPDIKERSESQIVRERELAHAKFLCCSAAESRFDPIVLQKRTLHRGASLGGDQPNMSCGAFPLSSPYAAAASDAAAAADTGSYCLLCDAPFSNWVAHCELPAHAARAAICEAFVKPERSASMLSQLEQHIGLDFTAVEEASLLKVERRQRRLRSSLAFLLAQKVLHRCRPLTTPAGPDGEGTGKGEGERERERERGARLQQGGEMNVPDGFLTCAIVGAAYAKEELTDRVARLAPRSSGVSVQRMVEYLTSARQWSKLFDQLHLQGPLGLTESHGRPQPESSSVQKIDATKAAGEDSAVGTEASASATSSPTSDNPEEPAGVVASPRPVWRFTQHQKVMLMLSCIGELRLFMTKDRSYKVDSKSVTDSLVHHVLATHCGENLLSELLHYNLEKVVEESTPVWRAYQAQEEEMRMRAYQARAPPVSPVPQPAIEKKLTPAESSPATVERRTADLRGLFPAKYTSAVPPATGAALDSATATAALEASIPTPASSPGTPPSGRALGSRLAAGSGTESGLGKPAGVRSSLRGVGTLRGHWQEVHRQLLYERPVAPADSPSGTFAGVYPRLQPITRSS
eukprot:gene11912-8194_t